MKEWQNDERNALKHIFSINLQSTLLIIIQSYTPLHVLPYIEFANLFSRSSLCLWIVSVLVFRSIFRATCMNVCIDAVWHEAKATRMIPVEPNWWMYARRRHRLPLNWQCSHFETAHTCQFAQTYLLLFGTNSPKRYVRRMRKIHKLWKWCKRSMISYTSPDDQDYYSLCSVKNLHSVFFTIFG